MDRENTYRAISGQSGHILVAAALFIMLSATSVLAGSAPCSPGMPCTTILTPGQLLDPSTGPNANKGQTISPNVNNPAANACDANFMNQIYAKAFLEAERETVINSALMHKPDSVMEYTCLDQQISRAATIAGPIFGETTRWVGASVPVGSFGGGVAFPAPVLNVYMGADNLDLAIQSLVLRALNDYADDNFAHTFLGGNVAADNNSIVPNVTTSVTFACDFMYNIHHVAKCSDFALDAPFMTFTELLSIDPRTQPGACNAGHMITADLMNVATNANNAYVGFDDVSDPTPLTREVRLGINVTDPASGTGCENDSPIPTGVMTIYERLGEDPAGNPVVFENYTYEDKVCSNPGCYFDNNNNANPSDDRCVP